jgi:hypothetical protein
MQNTLCAHMQMVCNIYIDPSLNATSETQYFCSGKRRRLQYQFFSLVYLNNKIIKYFCILVYVDKNQDCAPHAVRALENTYRAAGCNWCMTN